MRILIIKLSAFGDIIHSLPAVEDLIRNPKVSEVHWLIDHRYAFLRPVLPEAVVYHVLPRGQGVLHTWRRMQALRNMPWDAILDLQGLIKSGLLAKFVASRQNVPVYGFDASFSPEKPNAWLVQPVCFHASERHVVQQYRRIAMGPFLPDPSRPPDKGMAYRPPTVHPQAKMHNVAAALLHSLGLKARSYVLLHVGGGWSTKQLPRSSWLTLIEKIQHYDLTPVLVWGSSDERKRAASLADATGAMTMPTRLDIPTLAGLLLSARAVIGPDTGVLHLAAALGVPTATFWGPSASWRSGPLGDGHLHAQSAPPCGPCFKRECHRFICMDRIQISDLLGVLHGDS